MDIANLLNSSPPPFPPPPHSALKTAPDTTRDQRLQIQTLRTAGFTYSQIREQLGDVTLHQIAYAILHPLTPKKRKGKPSILTSEEVEEIITWVCLNKRNRRTPWYQIPTAIGLNVSYYCVRNALRKAGFARRVPRRKPPITERNRIARFEWAIQHLNWTYEDWKRILWSDETWINGNRHTKTYVTRRAGEEWDPTCIVERYQRRKGWMFWSCFNGDIKGPYVFWEKEWGSINAARYRERIVPLVEGWLRLNRNAGNELVFMQDSAHAHRAALTMEDLRERGIYCVK
jgi:transposase